MLQNFGKIVNQDLGLIPDLVIIEFLDFVLVKNAATGSRAVVLAISIGLHFIQL